MGFYPDKINARFNAPRNAGEADGANAGGIDASFICGSVLKFSFYIHPESKEILKASFATNGCGYMIAAADLLAETVRGKALVELHGLHDDVIRQWVETEFGLIEPGRAGCINAAISALHKTLADFRARQIGEWHGEKALICTCFGVSEDAIEQAIAAGNLLTVDEVTGACNAGGGCGSCQPLIREILDSRKIEML